MGGVLKYKIVAVVRKTQNVLRIACKLDRHYFEVHRWSEQVLPYQASALDRKMVQVVVEQIDFDISS